MRLCTSVWCSQVTAIPATVTCSTHWLCSDRWTFTDVFSLIMRLMSSLWLSNNSRAIFLPLPDCQFWRLQARISGVLERKLGSQLRSCFCLTHKILLLTSTISLYMPRKHVIYRKTVHLFNCVSYLSPLPITPFLKWTSFASLPRTFHWNIRQANIKASSQLQSILH